MCGRFTQHLSWEELHWLAGLIGQPRNLAPRYNIAPKTQIEVIRLAQTGKELAPMRWGLVPSWWEKPFNKLHVAILHHSSISYRNNPFGFWVLPVSMILCRTRKKRPLGSWPTTTHGLKDVPMRKSFKSSLAVALCGVMALTAMPTEVLAGPMSATAPTDIGLTAPIEMVHCRRHCHWRYVRYYHPRRYYRYGYRYDPAGAIFAGAALGLMGAGIAAATAPRYYGWGYPYGGWGW